MQRRTKFPKGLHDGNSDTAFCLGFLNPGGISINAAYHQNPTPLWSCTARLLSDITQVGRLNPEPRADCRPRNSLFIQSTVAMEFILHPQKVPKIQSLRHLSNNQSSPSTFSSNYYDSCASHWYVLCNSDQATAVNTY